MAALIFDFDGLIVDTEWPAFTTVADEFEAHGVSITLAEWQHRIGRADNAPWSTLLIERAGTIDVEVVERRRHRRKDELTDATPAQPGVHDVLADADAAGLGIAVASSSPLSWVERHLDRLALLDRFHAVRTRDDVEHAKPWPDVFHAAAVALGVEPSSCIVLEDSVHGVTAAKAAGMYCVAVPNRVTAGGDFAHADAVLGSLTEFDLHAHLSRTAASSRSVRRR